VEGLSYLSPQDLKHEVQAWLASFAPLVMSGEAPTEEQVMKRLGLILDLRQRGGQLRLRLGDLGYEEQELATTFRRAVEQLPSLEEDTRRLLGLLKPGDPRGLPDLDQLRARLDDREARQELGAPTHPFLGENDALVEDGSPSQPLQAVAQLAMSAGVLAFTTVHAVLMIGGMYAAFGPLALLLLAFYSIFFMAGMSLGASAITTGAKETITLHGRNLTIRRELGPIDTQKTVTLGPKSLPSIGRPQAFRSVKQGEMPQTALLMTDDQGREVSFGAGMTHEAKTVLRDRIIAYLRASDRAGHSLQQI
jgi:hypothetical protein